MASRDHQTSKGTMRTCLVQISEHKQPVDSAITRRLLFCNTCFVLCRGKVEGFLLSHDVTWEGPRRKLSELQALEEVVYDYIWPVFNLHVGGHSQTEPLGFYARLCSVRHV